LKELRPKVSTHGKAYVYAVENLVTGLLFGAKQDDFDFMIEADKSGVPEVWECRPDVFQTVYQGKSCWVYTVEEGSFQRGITSWEPELVSEEVVPVLEETAVPDLYTRLLEEEQKGTLRVHRYAYTDGYRRKIAAHIVDRLVRFDLDPARLLEQDERFQESYQKLAKTFLQITDGHLLP